MTEEIIVNGFDVSECYADNKMMKDGLYCFWEGGNCEDNEYCYYKECKRLEQERDELKKACEKCKLFDIEKTNRDLLERIDELEQENKILKSNTNVLNDYILKNEQLKTNIDHLVKINERLKQENKELKEQLLEDKILDEHIESLSREDIYRSALEEINILAKNYCNACDEFKAKTYKNKNGCLYCNYGFIKRKINEVLNEN